MARAVLEFAIRGAALLVLVPAFVAVAKGADQSPCSSKRLDRQTQLLQQQMTAGIFYKELLLLFGKPLTCAVNVQNGRTNLTYTFRQGAQLIARTDPAAELSEQRVESIHIDTAKAIALLKRAELDAYRPDGCGISWTSGEEESAPGGPGRREIVYRGDTCNCQARLTYSGNDVVILVLRSAC